MKATEQYFPVVLFIMLYKVVLTFESVDKILWCDHSNESYWAVLSCGTVYYAVQGDSNFWVCGRNPKQRRDPCSRAQRTQRITGSAFRKFFLSSWLANSQWRFSHANDSTQVKAQNKEFRYPVYRPPSSPQKKSEGRGACTQVNSRGFKLRRFWATHINRKWAFLPFGLDAIKFVLLSVFTLKKTICPRICSKSRRKSAKNSTYVWRASLENVAA